MSMEVFNTAVVLLMFLAVVIGCLFFYMKNIQYALMCENSNEAIFRLIFVFFPIFGIIAGLFPPISKRRI